VIRTDALEAGTEVETTSTAHVVEGTDVLVVGAGPAGVAAALAAARSGARTILAEASGIVGGMMTGGNAGLTNFIVHQKDPAVQEEILAQLARTPEKVRIVGGIPLEIAHRLIESDAAVGTAGTAGSYVFASPVPFRYLLLDLLEEAAVKLMLRALAVDVVLRDRRIDGVVFETKAGRVIVPADVVIDASGDGDVAARAGCPFVLGIGPDDAAARADPSKLGAMSAMGIMYRVGNVDFGRCFQFLFEHPERFRIQSLALYTLEEAWTRFQQGEMFTMVVKCRQFGLQVYNSPDPGVATLCCPCWNGNGLDNDDRVRGELAMRDLVRRQLRDIRGIPGFDRAFLLDCPDVRVRETRRVRGEYVLTVEDVLTGRDFPDAIGRGAHTVDASDVPEEIRKRPIPRDWCFHIPFRCLLPKGPRGLLMAGRCASMTHEAFGCTRTTVQCMVMGEAAGTAAALAATRRTDPHLLDINALRRALETHGVLL